MRLEMARVKPDFLQYNLKKEDAMDIKKEIEKVAYELYEKDGRQDGKDMEYWLQAEKIVHNRSNRAVDPKKMEKAQKPAPAIAASQLKGIRQTSAVKRK